jgi:CUE domain
LGIKPTQQESSDWATQEDISNDDPSAEVAELKLKYANQLKTLREVFPDWTAEDLVFALQEVDGDVTLATDRIAGGGFSVGWADVVGHAAQWGQVKKKSMKDKPKPTGRADGPGAATSIRGRGRGGTDRGIERGGRGRGGIFVVNLANLQKEEEVAAEEKDVAEGRVVPEDAVQLQGRSI